MRNIIYLATSVSTGFECLSDVIYYYVMLINASEDTVSVHKEHSENEVKPQDLTNAVVLFLGSDFPYSHSDAEPRERQGLLQ